MNTKKTCAYPNPYVRITAMPNSLDSWSRMRGKDASPSLVVALAAMALSGCTSDEASRFLVQTDKYMLYNCQALATAMQGNANRQRELEALMTKAGVDAGGRLVSNMTYQPEYLQLRGQMDQLRKTATEKNCSPPAGASGAGAHPSEQIRR